jgi:hypothetical protein
MADKGGKIEEVVSDMVMEEKVAAIDAVKAGTGEVETVIASPSLSAVVVRVRSGSGGWMKLEVDARASRSPEGADGQCNTHRTGLFNAGSP